MSKRDGTRVVTGRVRLNFPKLFTPEQIQGEGDPKYSVMVLIDKKDKDTIKNLRAAEEEATTNGKEKFGGKAPTHPTIIKDADEDGSAEDYPERAGHLYLTVSASAQRRPGVVDADLNDVIDQSEVYSGVYAKVSITAFPYTYGKSKRGISFGLNNVQVLGEGESLAGGKRAKDEFEVEESEENAALL